MSTSSAGEPPRGYHHGDLRATLLQAAGALLVESGAGAISLREAARRAGVSHSAPYRHFADRQSLLAALAAEGFAELGARAGQVADLADFGRLYVEFALEQPGRFGLMFSAELDKARHPDLAQASKRLHDLLEAGVSRVAPSRDPQVVATAAWSLVHGLAHLLLAQQLGALDESSRRTMIEAVTRLFGEGLRG